MEGKVQINVYVFNILKELWKGTVLFEETEILKVNITADVNTTTAKVWLRDGAEVSITKNW